MPSAVLAMLELSSYSDRPAHSVNYSVALVTGAFTSTCSRTLTDCPLRSLPLHATRTRAYLVPARVAGAVCVALAVTWGLGHGAT